MRDRGPGLRGLRRGRRGARPRRSRRPRPRPPSPRRPPPPADDQRPAARRRRQHRQPGDQLGHGRPRRRDDHDRLRARRSTASAPGEKEAEKLTGQLDGGTVSGNLVVRFAGPNDLLASGHPQEGDLPENLGLIRSKDHGETWTAVEGVEEADYHELEIVGDQLIAVEAESPDIKVSRDGGRSWETRTPPDAPIDVVVNPARPRPLGGLDRAGHVRLDQWRPVLAPARYDLRGAADLAERRLALQRRPQRADSCQQGRRTQLGGPRRGRRPAERSRRAGARMSSSSPLSEGRSDARGTAENRGPRPPPCADAPSDGWAVRRTNPRRFAGSSRKSSLTSALKIG